MKLDLKSLENAIAQLEDAIKYSESDLAKNDSKLALHLRAAAIQAFEFTYELSFKTVKRYLEATEADPSIVEKMDFAQIIRRGFEIGILQAEMSDWKEFRKDRGTTSHTYDESKAIDVYETIPTFLKEAKFLYTQIIDRQGK